MKNKDKLIKKISKSVIVVFGVLTVFNVIMLINKKSYALFQKTVETDKVIHIETASELPIENKGTDVVKATVEQDGGIKGVDPNNGTICEDADCPEYRYVGTNVNNYVYFNCTPNVDQNDTNCEMWRIVGVFKDESNKEHLKIVKDKVLTADMFPDTYTFGGTTYEIKYTSGDNACWNSIVGGTVPNNWAKAGLQYWLNSESDQGYLSKLKTGVIDMIADTKYYLGTFNYGAYGSDGDTPIAAYKHERDVGSCQDNTSKTNNQNGCYVWVLNEATWTGKIGLLYPSDYGFSADSSNWTTALYDYKNASGWLGSSVVEEWLLSPASKGTRNSASRWKNKRVDPVSVGSESGVRPVLYLESGVGITGGNGTQGNPYQLG